MKHRFSPVRFSSRVSSLVWLSGYRFSSFRKHVKSNKKSASRATRRFCLFRVIFPFGTRQRRILRTDLDLRAVGFTATVLDGGQCRAALERRAADFLDTFAECHRCETIAEIERAPADFGHTVGELLYLI